MTFSFEFRNCLIKAKVLREVAFIMLVFISLKFLLKVGSDGGRHGWFKWADGPVPEGTSLTQSISIYDCMIVSISSLPGTAQYEWKEDRSNSDKNTRVLGKYCLDVHMIIGF